MLRKISFVFTVILSMATLLGCSSGDDNNQETIGKNNKTDVAVTGGVTEFGLTYALINGYVNLDKLPSSVKSEAIGVEVNREPDMSGSSSTETSEELNADNQFEVVFTGLDAGIKYYYRTYVRGNDGVTRYGEIRSFTTNDKFSNIMVINTFSASYTSAYLTWSIDTTKIVKNSYDRNDMDYGIAYSTSPSRLTQDSIKYAQIERPEYYWHDKSIGDYIPMNYLKPGTIYFCCPFTYIGGKLVLGEIKTFQTKFVDGSIDTKAASDITACSATLNGSISISNADRDRYGFVYSTSSNFEGRDYSDANNAPSQGGSFSYSLSGLLPNTTYYYKAYVILGNYTYYSSINSFTTKNIATSGYVDLGLSSGTKWSACNYGAKTPYEDGTSELFEAIYWITTREFDVPGRFLMNELLDKCHWTHIKYKGKDGYIVTGPNGNSIFLPEGKYWSNNQYVDNPGCEGYYLSVKDTPSLKHMDIRNNAFMRLITR